MYTKVYINSNMYNTNIQIYCNDKTNIISPLKDESWAGKKKRVNSDFLRPTKQFKVLTVVLSNVT